MTHQKAQHLAAMSRLQRIQAEVRRESAYPDDYFDAIEDAVRTWEALRAVERVQEDAEAAIPYVIGEIGI
jgi:F0F1-type ATP synthase gamma subunit